MEEIWKTIEGFPDYQVSNMGRVRSVDRVDSRGRNLKGKVLKLHINIKGYLVVGIYSKGKMSSKFVHRLAAQAFIENYSDELEVDHVDFDRTNNKLSNLRCVPHKENVQHSFNNGRHTKANEDMSKTVYVSRNSDTLAIFSSTVQAGQYLNISNAQVSHLCIGRYGINGYCQKLDLTFSYTKPDNLELSGDYIHYPIFLQSLPEEVLRVS